MNRSRKYLSAVAVAAGVLIAAGVSAPVASQDGAIGEGLVMYFQMGGNPGGGATLARTNGARAVPLRKRSASTCGSSIPPGSRTR